MLESSDLPNNQTTSYVRAKSKNVKKSSKFFTRFGFEIKVKCFQEGVLLVLCSFAYNKFYSNWFNYQYHFVGDWGHP
jgi:hypothetical protein